MLLTLRTTVPHNSRSPYALHKPSRSEVVPFYVTMLA